MRRVIDHDTQRLIGLADDKPELHLHTIIKYRRKVYRVMGSLTTKLIPVQEVDPNTPADMRLHDRSPRLKEMVRRLARKYPPR